MENNFQDLFSNPIKFKLFCAEFKLKSLPKSVPLDSKNKILLEMNIEEFLFFSVNAIDILLQGINKKLDLKILSHRINQKTIIDTLNINKNQKSELILKQFENFFQIPTHQEKIISDEEFSKASAESVNAMIFFSEYENRNRIKYHHVWNKSKSSLWILRNQRNLITHNSLLTDGGLRGTVPAKDFLRVYLVYNNSNIKIWDSLYCENPWKFYSDSFNDVWKFIENIHSILNS